MIGAREAREAMLAEVEQCKIVRQRFANEFCAQLRQHDLSAVGRRHQPAGAIERCSEIVAVAFLGLAGVNADAAAQRTGCSPLFGRERASGHDCRGDGRGRLAEHGVPAVAHRLDHRAVVRFDRVSQHGVVAYKRRPHGVGMLLPETRRTLEVGEHEGHDARGQIRHQLAFSG